MDIENERLPEPVRSIDVDAREDFHRWVDEELDWELDDGEDEETS